MKNLVDTIIKLDMNEIDDYDFPFELDSSKRCPICGNKVSRDTKVYCDECTWYDPNYKGGYCERKHEPVKSSGSCGSWKSR